MSRLYINITYFLAEAQGGGGNVIKTRTNTKGRDPNNIYVGGPNNIESWIVKKSKDKITRDGQYWWCYPNHKMKGKFMECTRSNHPKSMMNGPKKNRGR